MRPAQAGQLRESVPLEVRSLWAQLVPLILRLIRWKDDDEGVTAEDKDATVGQRQHVADIYSTPGALTFSRPASAFTLTLSIEPVFTLASVLVSHGLSLGVKFSDSCESA